MIIIRAQVPSLGAMVRLMIVTSNTTIYWLLLGGSQRDHTLIVPSLDAVIISLPLG